MINFKNNFLAFLICAIIFLFQGCTIITPQELETSAKNKKVCCKTFADIEYMTLKPDSGREFLIDDQFPVYNFPSGKSHFVAVKFPPHEEQRILNIYADVRRYGNTELGYYFLPNIITLDSQFSTKRTITTPVQPFIRSARADSVIHLPIAIESDEQYFIIYTDPSVYKDEFSYTYISVTDNYTVGVQFRTPYRGKAIFSYGGVLTVENIGIYQLDNQ
jgi:hypothetical protein